MIRSSRGLDLRGPSIAQEPTPAEATSGPEDDPLAAPGSSSRAIERTPSNRSRRSRPSDRSRPGLADLHGRARPPCPFRARGSSSSTRCRRTAHAPRTSRRLFPELGPGPLTRGAEQARSGHQDRLPSLVQSRDSPALRRLVVLLEELAERVVGGHLSRSLSLRRSTRSPRSKRSPGPPRRGPPRPRAPSTR